MVFMPSLGPTITSIQYLPISVANGPLREPWAPPKTQLDGVIDLLSWRAGPVRLMVGRSNENQMSQGKYNYEIIEQLD